MFFFPFSKTSIFQSAEINWPNCMHIFVNISIFIYFSCYCPIFLPYLWSILAIYCTLFHYSHLPTFSSFPSFFLSNARCHWTWARFPFRQCSWYIHSLSVVFKWTLSKSSLLVDLLRWPSKRIPLTFAAHAKALFRIVGQKCVPVSGSLKAWRTAAVFFFFFNY